MKLLLIKISLFDTACLNNATNTYNFNRNIFIKSFTNGYGEAKDKCWLLSSGGCMHYLLKGVHCTTCWGGCIALLSEEGAVHYLLRWVHCTTCWGGCMYYLLRWVHALLAEVGACITRCDRTIPHYPVSAAAYKWKTTTAYIMLLNTLYFKLVSYRYHYYYWEFEFFITALAMVLILEDNSEVRIGDHGFFY